MDQFQLFFRDRPAGPVRGSWEEAARDAVAAGLATWVGSSPHTGNQLGQRCQASIARVITQPRSADIHRYYTACAYPERRGQCQVTSG